MKPARVSAALNRFEDHALVLRDEILDRLGVVAKQRCGNPDAERRHASKLDRLGLMELKRMPSVHPPSGQMNQERLEQTASVVGGDE